MMQIKINLILVSCHNLAFEFLQSRKEKGKGKERKHEKPNKFLP